MCGWSSSRGDPDLGEEALAAEHRGQLGAQDLEGDVAVVLEVVREIDRRHAARAELALDAVAVPRVPPSGQTTPSSLTYGREGMIWKMR